MKTKKILALILALTLMLFAFAGCSSQSGGNTSAEGTSEGASDEEAPSAVYNTRNGITLNILIKDGDEASAAIGEAVSSILTEMGYTSEVVKSEDIEAAGEEGTQALALITNDFAAGFRILGYSAMAKMSQNCILVASTELVSDEIAADVLTAIAAGADKIAAAYEGTSEFTINGADKDVIIRLHPGASAYYDSLDEEQQ